MGSCFWRYCNETKITFYQTMKQLIPLFLILIVLLSACSSPVKTPENKMSKSEFTETLTDFYLYKNINPQFYDGQMPNFQEINGYILTKHQITATQFKENYAYYMLNEADAKDILEDVQDNLKDKAEELEIKITTEKPNKNLNEIH